VTEFAPTATSACGVSGSGYRLAWGLAVLTALSFIADQTPALSDHSEYGPPPRTLILRYSAEYLRQLNAVAKGW